MKKLQWTIRKLKWMTPKEEKILVDTILLYMTGLGFILFIGVFIGGLVVALIRGIM